MKNTKECSSGDSCEAYYYNDGKDYAGIKNTRAKNQANGNIGLYLRDFLLIALGSSFIAGAVACFAEHNLAFGGVTGLAIITRELTGIPIHITNFVLSFVLLMWGGIKKGLVFVIKSLTAIALISWIFIPLTQRLVIVPSNIILAAFVGALLLGVGVGIILRIGGSTGGPDSVAALLKERIPEEWTMRIIDSTILIIGIFVFGPNNLYSIIIPIVTPFVVGKVLDSNWIIVLFNRFMAKPKIAKA